jgi:hypothetical protein
MKRSTAGLGVAALIAALSNAVPATELVVNGGFETGDLTGWAALGPVSVESASLGVTPNSGTSMAVIGGFPAPSQNALLAQTAEIDTSLVDTVNVSFAYNLQASDISEFDDIGVDALAVGVLPAGSLGFGSLANALILLSVPFNDLFGGGPEVLGWTTFSETITDIPDMGLVDFILGFGVQNTDDLGFIGDNGQLFAAYIDDVSVTTVPEPSALLLLSIALAGLGLSRRRSSSAAF